LTCRLQPGSQIAQNQLVEQFDLGLTPVREALKRLEMEGFVQSIPRFGYIITPITHKDVEEIYELRIVLETAAVRLATKRASDEMLSVLAKSATFSYQYHDTQSYQEFLEQNKMFHITIALLARNQHMADILANLLDKSHRMFHAGLELRDSSEEMQREHLDLVNAMMARDADRAAQLCEEQIITSSERIFEMLQNRQDRSASLISYLGQ
ncbi:MAG TPA: GntR family transcriptional regulator, partial [Bellilinea sp.]|nr:GntR family transcriptional regulator [Bellilinea sp.]